MPNDDDQSPAEYFYSEGMKYDLRQDEWPEAAALARAAFERAADMGHLKAARALAHYYYAGRGGPQDRERGLWNLWAAFNRGDQEALEELGDLLGSYSAEVQKPDEAQRAARVADMIGDLNSGLEVVSTFMRELRKLAP